MSFDPNSMEVQQILAKILENPSIQTSEILKGFFSEKSLNEQADILIGVQNVFRNLLADYDGGGPGSFHRLEFCWKVMKEADKLIRKKGKQIPSHIIKCDDLKTFFHGLIKTEQLHCCFLETLGSVLQINRDGSYLKLYYEFLNPRKKTKFIGIALKDKDGHVIIDNLRRIIWWIIRKYRCEYVDIESGDPFQIHFTWLVRNTRKEVYMRCNPREVDLIQNLNEEIENQIDAWLTYNCLQGDNAPTNASDLRLIAKTFNEENNLKGSKILSDSDIDQVSKMRIAELEKEISRYAEENRKLEEENGKIRRKLSAQDPETVIPKAYENGAGMAIMELQDFLTTIDNKYPLDVLRSIQLGEDPIITMKNFVGHLFYVLRKKGLVTYPSEEEFILDYDQSGLYQCLGFEVPPDGKLKVKIEKPGWGLFIGSRLFPIRKAILRKS